jgi:hypothetical protein
MERVAALAGTIASGVPNRSFGGLLFCFSYLRIFARNRTAKRLHAPRANRQRYCLKFKRREPVMDL